MHYNSIFPLEQYCHFCNLIICCINFILQKFQSTAILNKLSTSIFRSRSYICLSLSSFCNQCPLLKFSTFLAILAILSNIYVLINYFYVDLNSFFMLFSFIFMEFHITSRIFLHVNLPFDFVSIYQIFTFFSNSPILFKFFCKSCKFYLISTNFI